MIRFASALALVAAGAVLVLAPAAVAGTSGPDDPYFVAGDQWALAGATASIGAPQAWCASTGGGILTADVDTGADFRHRDLAGKLVPGAAFLSGRGDPGSPDGTGPAAVQDDNGHGTMTTGIMAAGNGNGIGIAAVAPASQALVVKVLDRQGSGYTADVAAGIEYAVNRGARVVNLSLGSEIPLTGSATSIPGAIGYAYQHGAAVAIAAGNDSLPSSDYQLTPVEQEALVVGALGPRGEVAYYSAYGQGVNVYAPGGDDSYSGSVHGEIVSTALGGGYAIGEGTSFATPQVSGVLALLMARGLSNAQARQRILDTAVSRGGVPELDAARALGAHGACPARHGEARTISTAQAGGNAGSAPGAAASRPANRTSQSATAPAVPGNPPSAPGQSNPAAGNPTPKRMLGNAGADWRRLAIIAAAAAVGLGFIGYMGLRMPR